LKETVREHPIGKIAERTIGYEEKMKTAIRYELELKVPLENTLTEKTLFKKQKKSHKANGNHRDQTN
jgi:hypothetical protein